MEYKCIKFDKAGGSYVVYKGYHWKTNAPTNDNKWSIIKFTWDGSDCTMKQYSEGKWDDRASMNW